MIILTAKIHNNSIKSKSPQKRHGNRSKINDNHPKGGVIIKTRLFNRALLRWVGGYLVILPPQ